MRYILLIFSIFTLSCSKERKVKDITSEPILGKAHTEDLSITPPKQQTPAPYPWQSEFSCTLRPITKEFFRCRGSSLHPPRIVTDGSKEIQRYYDCGGSEKHSLPLRDQKEYVYPILIELLNELQCKTKLPVIVTSGHRCPTHQAYIDSSPKGSASKHLIAAEVSFYVQGLEEKPQELLNAIFDYYKTKECYKNQKEYITFSRFEKETDVSTPPWQNKEIFIKLYKKGEGRDFDNRHPYPYIRIQVRFDREKNERVQVTHAAAQALLRK